eukprot:8601857-Karenia_brevis.AAC.1
MRYMFMGNKARGSSESQDSKHEDQFFARMSSMFDTKLEQLHDSMSALESKFQHLSMDVDRKIHFTKQQFSSDLTGVASRIDTMSKKFDEVQRENS